ncbi:MAG: hypothetical protein WCW27_06110 [Patescibacteria group bacterium]|jgi:hypothetical protein
MQQCDRLNKLTQKKAPSIPDFNSDVNEINQNINKINLIVEKIITSLKQKIKEESLSADKFIEELFSVSRLLEYSDEIIKKAKNRFDLDIPPGKNGSYGDATIWESLLKEFPAGEDLHFVGFDNDFKSRIDDNDFSPYLLKEWSKLKKSKIIPYKDLGNFTRSKIPKIKQSEKIIKQEDNIDKNYLVTSTALKSAIKEMSKASTEMQNIIASCLQPSKEFLRTLSAINATTIPIDAIRQFQNTIPSLSNNVSYTLREPAPKNINDKNRTNIIDK